MASKVAVAHLDSISQKFDFSRENIEPLVQTLHDHALLQDVRYPSSHLFRARTEERSGHRRLGNAPHGCAGRGLQGGRLCSVL